MARVIGKEQLCSTENYRVYFKSIQGLGNHTLFTRYDAIENVVNKKIDEKYRHFLAQPVVDGDLISWFSKPYSETPQQLSALEGEKQAKYEQIKNDTIAHYKSAVNSLRQEGKTSEAECIENAIKFVDDRFVYCFDDKAVLGIWGMQLRNEVREPVGTAMKNDFLRKPKTASETELISELQPGIEPEQQPDTEPEQQPESPASLYTVHFNPGGDGRINGVSEFTKHTNESISEDEVPGIEAREGYEFIGWDKDPREYTIVDDTEFIAQYRRSAIPPVKLPLYTRFWNWLRTLFMGRGCWKWLLWLLFLLLLLLLLWWLLRSCNDDRVTPIPSRVEDKPYIQDDPRSGKGGIYNPGDPYKPLPTPPDYRDVLPPNQGVLPPVDTTKIIRDPGNPAILGNRLNIIMENEDKSIMDLAKDFKAKYPGGKYKVVYYDDVVKRMQIEVPAEEREQLKQEIPAKFAPEYKLFVFDEALFEGSYTPNDPAFSDPDKSWYLKAVKAPQAWDITKGSAKLTVAIVDNGFNLNHPELKSKVVMPYNVWLHSSKIFPQKLDHGTHVAGTALAIMDNEKGICGIAPECFFMPIQVADANELMTTTSVLDGILYALYQGADVVNVSVGSQFTGLDKFPKEYQEELVRNRYKEEERLWTEIARIANKHKATVVVAAGNDNILAGIDPIQRPKDIVTVGAVTKDNQAYDKADFSNYGSYATIAAPGVNIYSSVGDGNYTVMEGTSMAAPIITGTIALMKSLNDSLTNEQIICILQSTGLAANGNVGNLVQIDKALAKVKSGDFRNCGKRPATPSSGDVQVLLNWKNYNDLDLACTDPRGNIVWYKNKTVPSGGQLEIDMNVLYPDSKTPIENIFWPTGRAPKGTYKVSLVYYKNHEAAINETPYTIIVKYGGKTQQFQGIIKKEDGTVPICTFTLGSAGNSPSPQSHEKGTSNGENNLLLERKKWQQESDRVNNELRKNGNQKIVKK
jgi:subtilisin family serine protease